MMSASERTSSSSDVGSPGSPMHAYGSSAQESAEARQERGRVYLACIACRTRKIKCDGARPVCATCIKRKNKSCVYDEMPKRRGPDRQPRARPHIDAPAPSVSRGTTKPRREREREQERAQPNVDSFRNELYSAGRNPTKPVLSSSSSSEMQIDREPPPRNKSYVPHGAETSDRGILPRISLTPSPAVPLVFPTSPNISSSSSTSTSSVPRRPHPSTLPPPNPGLTAGSFNPVQSFDSMRLPPVPVPVPVPPPLPSRNGRLSFILNPSHATDEIPITSPSQSSSSLRPSLPPTTLPHLHTVPTQQPAAAAAEYNNPPRSLSDYPPRANSHTASSSASSDSPYTPHSTISAVTRHPYPHPHPHPVQQDSVPGIQQQQQHDLSSPIFSNASSSFPIVPTGIFSHPSQSSSSSLSYAFESVLPKGQGQGQGQNSHLGFIHQNTDVFVFGESPSRFEEVGMEYSEVPYEVPYGLITAEQGQSPEQDDEDQRRSRSSQLGSEAGGQMTSQPSLDFSRQVWWDVLIKSYGHDRGLSTRLIMDDISHLFQVSNYFVSFINVPLFLSTFHHPSQRELIQPALVLSVLALSVFFKSSNLGLGKEGRARALKLRDEAQAALEGSLNDGWITPGLAQAALLLAIFEVSCHPDHTEQRACSALSILDSIITAMGLLHMDATEWNVTTFEEKAVPSIGPGPTSPLPTHPAHIPSDDHGMQDGGCSCVLFKLGTTSPSAGKISPFWLGTAGWNANWTVGEIKREEQRRLVWNALTLGTAHLSYFASLGVRPLSLNITKPSMYKVLFPGETLYRDSGLVVSQSEDLFDDPDPAPKHSVWALYARSQLLYASCLNMQFDDSIDAMAKSDFAVRAWLETERIEASLDLHSCDIEKATIYHGREYLFNTQNLVSSHYSRYVPHPNIGDPSFNREKAVIWLTHQQRVANNLLGGLETITGLHAILLAKRPYFIFWFHGQIARYLSVWEQDHSLIVALDLSKSLLAPIEYLITIFPSSYQSRRYEELHYRLSESCAVAGIPPPPPPNLNRPVMREV